MTKEQALQLKDGDVIYVIDDTRASMFTECGAQNSPLVRTGLQRVVIGEKGGDGRWSTIHVFDVTGYLIGFAFQRNIEPEMFFSDVNEAASAFTAIAQKMQAELQETIDQIQARIDEAAKLTAQPALT